MSMVQCERQSQGAGSRQWRPLMPETDHQWPVACEILDIKVSDFKKVILLPFNLIQF